MKIDGIEHHWHLAGCKFPAADCDCPQPVATVEPATSSTSADVNSLIALAMFARDNGFLIDHVEVGSVKLRIRDLRIDRLEGLKPELSQQRDPWEEAGVEGGLPSDGTVG